MTNANCPDCRTNQWVGGNTTTCAHCGLVAPTSAFTTHPNSANQAPQAWTISGDVD